MKLPRSLRVLVCLVYALALNASVLESACARHQPPNLTPSAQIAWKSHEVQKDLDLLRDVAVDANAQTPPILSTATTRKVVTYHASAIQIIHAGAGGWANVVQSGLDELVKDLSPSERAQLAPYVALVKTVLREMFP